MTRGPDRRPLTDAGTDEAIRTARLIFDAELSAGTVTLDQACEPGVLELLRTSKVPSGLARTFQAAVKDRDGFFGPARTSAAHVTIRRAVLGADAAAPPRFLVRVDEFPHFQAWDEPGRFGSTGFRRFHEIMRSAGVSYLVAAMPRVSRRPLDPSGRDWRPLSPEEVAVLERVRSDGVTIALHGRDHRTRYASPQRHSELCGLDQRQTAALLDEAVAELESATGERPQTFVAPYNRFQARQWPALARRFAIVTGGPESIRLIGVRPSPQWWGDAVYLPAYSPLYGTSARALPAVQRAIEAATGLWMPIVLHWGWEADAGWSDLERLASVLAPHALSWDEFLAAVQRSR